MDEVYIIREREKESEREREREKERERYRKYQWIIYAKCSYILIVEKYTSSKLHHCYNHMTAINNRVSVSVWLLSVCSQSSVIAVPLTVKAEICKFTRGETRFKKDF